jgi:aspartate-semialdehyde dehydrogenase
MTRGVTVGVVGATGMVGRELLRLLEKRRFPVSRLVAFASERSAGKTLKFDGRPVVISALKGADPFAGCDLVFFVSDKELSKRYAPALSARGVWVIDDSSAFRLDPKIPLIVPEINAASLGPKSRLIAGPNCAATPITMAAAAIGRRFGLRSVRAATYQSASGWGKAAMEELQAQARVWAKSGKVPRGKVLPRRLFLNLFPHIDKFDASGYTHEELKIAAETKKILGLKGLPVTATAVRVPVLVGHSMAVWLETEKPVSPAAARKSLAAFPGVRVIDDAKRPAYPTPNDAAGQDDVLAGRIRAGAHSRELLLWLSSDNLLKGAALNSVQVAEFLLKKGWLKG